MTRKLYKCFMCGKVYEDEQAALSCHDAPIQAIVQRDDLPKPRFLGN